MSALLPVVAGTAAYVVAAATESVPTCIPYFDGCTSISSTGRTHPSRWVFKPLILAAAVAMGAFFILAGRLTSHRDTRRVDPVVACGIVAALALIVYVTFLGSKVELFETLRRYGVSMFFGVTFLTQLLLARRLGGMRSATNRAARWMLIVCAALLIVGLASIPVSNFVVDNKRIENVIEWNFALLLHLNFLAAWRALAHHARIGR